MRSLEERLLRKTNSAAGPPSRRRAGDDQAPRPAREAAPEAHAPFGSQKGLTLVEILVSVVILAFVALGLMSVVTVAVRQNKLAQQRSVATSLASDRINRIMAQPFQSSANYLNYKLPDETAAAGPPQTFTSNYGAIPSFPNYKRVVTLTYNVPVSGMLRVETKVSWRDLHQGEKTHEIVTYLYPPLEEGK